MSHGGSKHNTSPNRKRRQLLSTTTKVNPKIENGFTTSKAFWKLFKASMGFMPPSSGYIPVSDDGGYAKFQAMVSDFRKRYGIRLDENEEEKMSGDREDPSREEADSKRMLADFEKRLSEQDKEYEYTPQMEDTLNWSDEAKQLADLISNDLRLEERRRPELTTRLFITNYFKTLRMKNMNIVRIDEGLNVFTSLRELSLSGNPLGSLQSLPKTLVVLNVYNCNIRNVGSETLPKLLHLGIGYNEVDDEVLNSFPNIFPSMLSLDISYNYICNFNKAMETLASMPKTTQLLIWGNPCTLIRGYTSRALVALQKVTRFDGNKIGADDRDHYAEELNKLNEEEENAKPPEPEPTEEEVMAEKEEEETDGKEQENDEGKGEKEEEEEGKTFEETATEEEDSNDYMTIFNINIKNVTNPPPPKIPPPPPAPVEEESSTESTKSKKGKKGGKKKGKTPEPSRPTSPEDMTPEDYKNLAEEQDFRYFVRIVPPSEAAEHIAYTTKAVSWDTDVNIGDVTELEIPRTGDLVPCIMFDGLKLELWESLPGDKPQPKEGEEDAEKKGDEEGEEGETVEEDIPRKDKLVAIAVVNLNELIDAKSNGVKSIDKTSIWKPPLGTRNKKLSEDVVVNISIGMNTIKPLEDAVVEE